MHPPEVQELMMAISLRPGLRCMAMRKDTNLALTTCVVPTFIDVLLGRCHMLRAFPQRWLPRRPMLLLLLLPGLGVAGPVAGVLRHSQARCRPPGLLRLWRSMRLCMRSIRMRARSEMAPPNLGVWIAG